MNWTPERQIAAANDFASFATALATALHKSKHSTFDTHGRRLGLDLSGDQNSPIDHFEVFAASNASAVDYFTLMGTYYHRTNGTVPAGGYAYGRTTRGIVERALKLGIPPAKLGTGIFTATRTRPCNPGNPGNTCWNATSLTGFARWLNMLGVGAIDLWRADIDHTSHTMPWMLDVLQKYKNGTVALTTDGDAV
jgi:hypothetical protein